MLYTEQMVRDNLRNREGKRVFYLGASDLLTSTARDFLARERIPVLPAEQARPERYALAGGGYLEEKPEHWTHLRGNVLVPKTHPVIAFRGALDTLQAELILGQLELPQEAKRLGELLQAARELIRCDVLEEPFTRDSLCGLTEQELRRRSQFPQEVYGRPHFMPEASDGAAVARLNRLRCAVRETELAAAAAFTGAEGQLTRQDILRALNRMSSMLYIMMIEEKGKGRSSAPGKPDRV